MGAGVGRAIVTPHYGPVEGLASLSVPRHRGLPLVGDAHARHAQLLPLVLGALQGARYAHVGRPHDFEGVVLDPPADPGCLRSRWQEACTLPRRSF